MKAAVVSVTHYTIGLAEFTMIVVWILLLLFGTSRTIQGDLCPDDGNYPCFTPLPSGNMTCVPANATCDGSVDCDIGDDEFYCKELPRDTSCHNKYVCPGDAACIDYDVICDGSKDCTSGGDEMGCNLTCPSSECVCGGLNVRCRNIRWNDTLSRLVPNDTILLYLFNLTMNTEDSNMEKERRAADVVVYLSDMERLKMIVIARNGIDRIRSGDFQTQHALKYLDLSNNIITELPDLAFDGLRNLRELYLHSNLIHTIERSSFEGLTTVEILFLQGNNIKQIYPETFHGLSSVHTMGLFQNNISEIPKGAFDGLTSLYYLDIGDNKITYIQSGSFSELRSLQYLHVYLNKLKDLQAGVFQGLTNLIYLDLTDNNIITHIEPGAFSNLSSLTELMIFPTDLKSPDEHMFSGLSNLETISADDYRFCCFFDDLSSCETPPSPFATCEGLLRRLSLRLCIWILGISAIIGNIFVIFWRWEDRKRSDTNTVQILLIINLAVSDLIMGFYMLIIGGADAFYGNHYYLQGETWRKHGLCKFAGVLSVLSSEASVLMVTVISIDRFLCVVFPFGSIRLRKKSAVVVITIMWILAAMFSIIPTILSQHIPGFYGLSDVCIGLPLVTTAKNFTMSLDESQEHGFVYYANESEEGPLWYFSIFLFIVLNLICFLIVLICYVAIFVSVKRSDGRRYRPAAHSDQNEQVKMAVKMAVIVWTDFCCWVPIILMGILSQSGVVDIPVEIYAWTVVFILPINSCINPYLYTISARMSGNKRNSLRRKKKKTLGSAEESQRLKTRTSFISDNTINLKIIPKETRNNTKIKK